MTLTRVAVVSMLLSFVVPGQKHLAAESVCRPNNTKKGSLCLTGMLGGRTTYSAEDGGCVQGAGGCYVI